MLSYWEKQSFTHYDIAIIGSGITGLSTAISLKEKDKTLRIVVLEKELLPTGASTKNAGFACIGSFTEIIADLQQHTQKEVIELVQWRKEGLEILRKRLGDKNICYQENGSYELIFEENDIRLNDLDFVNKLLFNVFNKKIITVR